jgi:regulator of nucleoside diphosphate kinase
MQHDPMRPAITLENAEHRQLLILAMTGPDHSAYDSDYLHYELDRASVVADATLPPEVVRLGSTVTYRSDGADVTVTLVHPDEADAPAGMISVLFPLGATLLGLRPGQSITRMGWDGDFRTFAVLSVTPPATRQ